MSPKLVIDLDSGIVARNFPAHYHCISGTAVKLQPWNSQNMPADHCTTVTTVVSLYNLTQTSATHH